MLLSIIYKRRPIPIFGGSAGFTLIEIVAVLVLLGVAALVVAARVPSMGENHLITQTEAIRSHLRYAQLRAMNSSVPWGIDFDSATSYYLFRDTTATRIALPGEGSDHISPIPGGVSVAPQQTITFDAWGRAGNASDLTITLSRGSDSETITITQNTSFIQ